MPHHTVYRLKDNDLDKDGQELADALHAGTGRLAGFLNQSVGTLSDTHSGKLCANTVKHVMQQSCWSLKMSRSHKRYAVQLYS